MLLSYFWYICCGHFGHYGYHLSSTIKKLSMNPSQSIGKSFTSLLFSDIKKCFYFNFRMLVTKKQCCWQFQDIYFRSSFRKYKICTRRSKKRWMWYWFQVNSFLAWYFKLMNQLSRKQKIFHLGKALSNTVSKSNRKWANFWVLLFEFLDFCYVLRTLINIYPSKNGLFWNVPEIDHQ